MANNIKEKHDLGNLIINEIMERNLFVTAGDTASGMSVAWHPNANAIIENVIADYMKIKESDDGTLV